MLWGNSSVVVALARYVRLQSDNSLSLFSLLGTWTENVARVLIKILANGDYYPPPCPLGTRGVSLMPLGFAKLLDCKFL
jgi:hypothetical protein